MPQKFTSRTPGRSLWDYARESEKQASYNDAVEIIQEFRLSFPEIPIAPEPLPDAKLTKHDADLLWRVEQ